MKRWAAITVLLYLAAAVSLAVPLYLACFGWGQKAQGLNEALGMIRDWAFWTCIGVSAIGQIALLAVPVGVAERRPQARRHLLVPVITAACLLGFLCVSAVGCVAVAIWKDDGLKMFNVFGDKGWQAWMALVLYVCVMWTVWATVFHRFLKKDDPTTLITRLMRWLLRGSILELLVAVPSHVIVRHRDDCCAPIITFWGISAGVTVMLISFGPGVFFLFAERMRRLQPKAGQAKQS
jgi:hypothetical protein